MTASSFPYVTRKSFAALAIGLAMILGPTAAWADPPPWAPAHGWRAQQGHKHGHKQKHKQYHAQPSGLPFGLDLGTCNRDVIGALLGGGAGAAVGSTIGKGSGNTAAIIGGAVLGAIVGGTIGRTMDQADHACTGQVLEYAADGQTIHWGGPQETYQVTPLQTYRSGDGRYCREYNTTAVIGSQTQQVYGTACRQPDGSWQLVS
ncbi:MAG: RT0821/Lpp0805 family surface protein [Kiloniellales bacterium]